VISHQDGVVEVRDAPIELQHSSALAKQSGAILRAPSICPPAWRSSVPRLGCHPASVGKKSGKMQETLPQELATAAAGMGGGDHSGWWVDLHDVAVVGEGLEEADLHPKLPHL